MQREPATQPVRDGTQRKQLRTSPCLLDLPGQVRRQIGKPTRVLALRLQDPGLGDAGQPGSMLRDGVAMVPGRKERGFGDQLMRLRALQDDSGTVHLVPNQANRAFQDDVKALHRVACPEEGLPHNQSDLCFCDGEQALDDGRHDRDHVSAGPDVLSFRA